MAIIDVDMHGRGDFVKMNKGDHKDSLDVFSLRKLPDTIACMIADIESDLMVFPEDEGGDESSDHRLAVIAATLKEYYPEYTVLVQGRLVHDMYIEEALNTL